MNSDIFLKVIFAVLETFAFFGIGAFLVVKKMLDKDSIKGMSGFAIHVLTPFLIFSSVTNNFTKEDLTTAWIYPVLGFSMMVLHCIFGYLFLPVLRHDSPVRKATFLHMAVVNNYLYLPLIVIEYIWGGKTTAALLLCSIGSTFGQWTIGIAVMAGNDMKKMFSNLISSNSIAVVAAVLYLLQPFRFPVQISNFLGKTGSLAIPLSMIFIGGSIYLSRSKWTSHIGDVFTTTIIRVLAIPLLTLVILRYLPLPETARNIAMVLAVMPGSAGSVLVMRGYGGDVDFAGQLVLSTTIFSLATMPLLLAFCL